MKQDVAFRHRIRSELSRLILKCNYQRPDNNSQIVKLLKDIASDKTIVITRAEKGQITVILDRCEYVDKCLALLNDTGTYTTINKDDTTWGKLIHFLETSWNLIECRLL